MHICFYNKCDLVHSGASLAGKILHWSYGKVDILCHNFYRSSMKVKSWTSFEMCPLNKR